MVEPCKGPMFKWFGAKWNASKHYPAPRFDIVIEPFAGSACYALRHAHLIKRAVLWDADCDVEVLWRWLIEVATPDDIMTIPVNNGIVDIRTLKLELEQMLLLKYWQRTNPQTATWQTSPWGDKPGQWTANTRKRVASQLQSIKTWEFRKPSPTEDVGTWFVDPPYQFNYRYQLPAIDYDKLAGAVQSMRGQVIVCEALEPRTGRRPTWLPFQDFRRTVTSRRKQTQSHHSVELIYEREG